MRTTDLFKNNRSAKKLNESLQKTFGKHIDLKSMDLPRLEDARNKLRTQLHDARSQSGFNENLENEAMTQAQWMLDAINAEIAEREEFIADPHQAEMSMEEETAAGGLRDPIWGSDEVLTVKGQWDEEYSVVDSPQGPLMAAWDVEGDWYQDQDGGEQEGYISFVVNIATGEIVDFESEDEDGSGPWKGLNNYAEEYPEEVAAYVKNHYGSNYEEIAAELEGGMETEPDNEPGGSYDGSDDAEALASAGFGSDEDYGYFGQDEGFDFTSQPGDSFDTARGRATMTKSGGVTHKRDYDKAIDYGDEDDKDDRDEDDSFAEPKPRGYYPGRGGNLTQKSIGRRPRLSDEPYESTTMEKAPPGAKAERMVKHIKKGYAKDGKLTDKEKSIAYATAWKQHNKANESDEQVDELKRSTVKSYAEKKKSAIKQNPPQNKQEVGKDLKGVKGALDRLKGVKPTSESVTTGEDMTKLYEGEIQQASAIVNAKTMVDRVGRWIEELSGMENDTLLQLGDSIRDEMSADLAKSFISSVAPAIQGALQNLKDTRETLASSVRMLTGEEQSAEMLGAEPGSDMAGDLGGEIGGAEPDMMNAGGEDEFGGFEEPADEFGASDAAAGGLGDTGRAQRESIDRSNNLLRILAG